jgi:general secretion pathway protein G
VEILKKRTFTLVELMVVIVIIGILVGVVIFQLVGSIDNSRLAKTTEDLQTISKAITRYKEKYGFWPRKLADLEYSGIIPKIPKDPWGGKYNFDLCFGLVGNFESAKEDSARLRTVRFKTQQYFYNNDKMKKKIEKFDVRGKKLQIINLTQDGTIQNFPLGAFCIDETDNFYIIDIGKHEVRIFDRNGNEYPDEYIDLSSYTPIDIEVGKSMLSGKSMYLRGKYYTPSAKLASYIYILTNNNKVVIFSDLSKDLLRELTPPRTDINDIEVGGKMYLLSAAGYIYIYNLTGTRLEKTIELPSVTGQWKNFTIMNRSYIALLNSTNKIYIYQYESTSGDIWELDSLSLDITAAKQISRDENNFLYVNNLNEMNIFYFDLNTEKLEKFFGPIIKKQPIKFNTTINTVNFAGLK